MNKNFPHHNLVGWTVGAKRWPYSCAHHDCWGTPWKGEVLALNDIRAWTNTLAFHGAPTQEDVDAHVFRLLDRGYLNKSVPVLWNFDEPNVYWEDLAGLKDYDADLSEWEHERETSRQRWEQRHDAKAA